MPLYEYQCLKCAEKLEVIQKVSDEPFTICPHCGGELKKLLSAPALQFKGSGFYITDYARSEKKEGPKEEKKKEATGGEKPAATDKKD